MAGYFEIGETKVRPGSYFNIGNNGDTSTADVVNGVSAVTVKADYGPLGKVIRVTKDENYKDIFGDGGTTEAIGQMFKGGAKEVLAVRLGSGGTDPSVTLKGGDEGADNVVTIMSRYVGTKPFSVTIKPKLTDNTVKQAIFYTGTAEFDTVEFQAGTGEVDALVAALSGNDHFSAVAGTGMGTKVISAVTQAVFTGGADPTTTVDSYSTGFTLLEPYQFNTICVDTEDTAVHSLLLAFLNRIFENGNLAIGTVAEETTVALETRMAHAAAFNDEKMVYVLNASIYEGETNITGYKVAARIAGLISAISSRISLTHYSLQGIGDIGEGLSNSNIITALKSGCLVISRDSNNLPWIEQGINTLVNPPADRDSGWKKIRRTKTRFELLRRANAATDALVGKVDNDKNGRSTIVSAIFGVGNDMIGEGKITKINVYENPQKTSDGDSCWFIIDVIDKDSAEHIYSNYNFQFSVNE